ncbi:MAG TPA: hypothetical protein VEP28_15040 [Rubrobacter sp.]|nr:hypothetical protein [Rubrobacter sp.]
MSFRFIERPSHPDFEALASILRRVDANSERGLDIKDYLSQWVDPDSVFYVAQERCKMALAGAIEEPGPDDVEMYEHLLVILAAVFVDGFSLGCEYSGPRP